MASMQVALVGDAHVGKHSFCERFLCASFEKRHFDRDGFTEYPVTLLTQFGKTILNIRVSSPERETVSDNMILHSHAAIIMFDVTSRVSYKNVPTHYRDIVRVCDNIPIVLVGNKVDLPERTVKAKHIMFHRKKNLQYYEVSANCNYNIEKPLLWLMKRMSANPDLMLVEAPPLTPPVAIMDQHRQSENEEELARANQVPLPDDDEDFC